ncbi:MFS transporter [Aureivirga sp. CE67]|uniref:MFS transporter n=1 Tax=Aureivirga sp. CE67 TaxID=1788983 RepID=UPI0018CA64CB|nr:MFS transporter [Aureivirga sp. CE67]
MTFSRNVQKFIVGQGLSNIGAMLKQVAISWFAYAITEDAFYLAFIVFMRSSIVFLVSPFAGSLADRYNKLKLLLLSNSILFLNTALLTILVFYDEITIAILIGIQIIYGFASGIEAPARQSFINDIITDKKDLSKIISINNTVFNVARVIGYTLGGVLISIIGIEYCFTIYSCLLFIVILIFYFIKYKPKNAIKSEKNFKNDFLEGVKYTINHNSISLLMIVMIFVTFLSLSYEVLLPVFVKNILNQDSKLFGFLMGMLGLGSITGGLLMIKKKNESKLENTLQLSILLFGILISVFAFTNSKYIAFLLLFLIGIQRIQIFTSLSVLVQNLVEDTKRGRVLGLYMMLFMISRSLGDLLMGFLSNFLGISFVIFLGGISSILLAFFLKFKLKNNDILNFSNS